MKKFSLILISNILFAQTQIYTFTLLMDYKEYKDSQVLDKDYTNFGDMLGVGIKYQSKTKPLKYSVKIEYAGGKSTYEGATWDGTPLKNTQSGVYILNLEGALGSKNLFLTLGYREWNRGKSPFIGDYNEKYYWGYLGIKYDYHFYFRYFAFLPKISYQTAISPKMKVYMGNEPILKLGDTDGFYVELPIYFRIKKQVWYLFYRFQYWHISKSDYAVLQTDTTRTLIYEPESITRNQYLGIGVIFNF